jgi:hypothetical protein
VERRGGGRTRFGRCTGGTDLAVSCMEGSQQRPTLQLVLCCTSTHTSTHTNTHTQMGQYREGGTAWLAHLQVLDLNLLLLRAALQHVNAVGLLQQVTLVSEERGRAQVRESLLDALELFPCQAQLRLWGTVTFGRVGAPARQAGLTGGGARGTTCGVLQQQLRGAHGHVCVNRLSACVGGVRRGQASSPVSCCRVRRALSTSTSAWDACSALRTSRSCRFWSSRVVMVF